MISYIIGKVADIQEGALILEAGHMGYYIHASSITLSQLSLGVEVQLHTALQIKENDISMIGFLSVEDVKMFGMLTSVSGVGTKAALAIQSALDTSRIILAILTEEVDELTLAQGVGKKLASRVVLELKDKLKNTEIAGNVAPQQNISQGNAQAKEEATSALVSLGYSKNEALRVVMELALADMTTEQIIRQALKRLAAE
ncbi:MAG: Holliday junction branch migration protein RuvA [Defluviitaleaceae bacterium]|nr:Holliday junction branch migration protein RuvA [Defluviitaleaceae bacterium]